MPVFFLYDHALLFVVDRGSIRFILSLSPLRIALFFISSVPKFIQGYNGKPALVTKSGTFTRRDNYIEFTINVNMWAFLAKKGLFALIPTFPEFVFNVGFTIEARNDEEMPGERAFIVGGGGLISVVCPISTTYFPHHVGCTHVIFIVTEVLLGGCRLMNLDPDKVVVDGVDDLEICTG